MELALTSLCNNMTTAAKNGDSCSLVVLGRGLTFAGWLGAFHASSALLSQATASGVKDMEIVASHSFDRTIIVTTTDLQRTV